jgi:DNA replication protein DnaC
MKLDIYQFNDEEAKLLFQLVEIRYEKKSVIVISNYNGWNQIFNEKILHLQYLIV